ncbi:pentapeptide repeat-containing protein [Georgenia wangjunii]|uniref:pentapeptide repeat-containing protein n=1 Tax=Georgenia wangjunii TaxID=3117730 RepID=UPI002F260A71
MGEAVPVRITRREDLGADCARCVALCCSALGFERSADFAFTKPAGEACVNLRADYRCGIHAELRPRGFKGCTVFDCFGAGQKVTQETFGGQTWVGDPERRRLMFAVFPVVRALHELLWYLDEALARPEATDLAEAAAHAYARLERLTLRPPAEILAVDVDGERGAAAAVLARVSERVRAHHRPPTPGRAAARVRPGADLVGAALRGADLRGANARGALLIAADLRGADLTGADLIGADLRDTDVAGADLAQALFLTQVQVNAARGDGATRIPASLERPSHW